MKFEAVYEKLCEPPGNKDNKQSDNSPKVKNHLYPFQW